MHKIVNDVRPGLTDMSVCLCESVVRCAVALLRLSWPVASFAHSYDVAFEIQYCTAPAHTHTHTKLVR